ncbi:hypothetical protein RI129_000500 [Pyrocoelia pectoralis]|uniref:Transposase domain-containing protein n=1 Tax=Pyrocoelia pectoralis TaxID=417401 RepID=A0AAN7VSF3_9COLE
MSLINNETQFKLSKHVVNNKIKHTLSSNLADVINQQPSKVSKVNNYMYCSMSNSVCTDDAICNNSTSIYPNTFSMSQSYDDNSNSTTNSPLLSDYSTYANDTESDFENTLSGNQSLESEGFHFASNCPTDFQTDLQNWTVEENISHTSLKKLLLILQKVDDISDLKKLPKDPRTILSTPRNVVAKEMNPGIFYYFGIAKSITNLLTHYNYTIPHNVKSIEVAVNVDGLPISSSTSDCLWPILIKPTFLDIKNPVTMVALYYGKEKPKNVNEYLQDFVNECNELSSNGLVIENNRYNFRVKMLVCDVPAKTYCLKIKGHNGRHSCTKCTCEGDMVDNVLCFLDIHNLQKRTDDAFRKQLDEDHHVGTSVLTELPNFNLVDDVVLDYMHQICLGVMKRMLTHKKYGWIFGKQPLKLSFSQIEKASEHLKNIKEFVPIEFARKTRPLQESKRYKATELKLLLLYTGPVIFKKILEPSIYNHFLTLSAAITILCHDDLIRIPDMISYANSLLACFVETSLNIYGPDFVAHNVHNLLHLATDVTRFGNLNNFSAFPFENYMQFLKKILRTSYKPLQQIVHRILEGMYAKDYKVKSKLTLPSQEHFEGPLLPACHSPQYKMLEMSNFTLKLNSADCYVLLENSDIVRVHNIASYSYNSLVIIGKVFEDKKAFFKIPCDSTNLGIFLVNTLKMSCLKTFPLLKIKSKLFYMPFDNNQAVILPLLHS